MDTPNNYEVRYAQISRSMAARLVHYARERRPEDKTAIAHLQHELCQLWKAEQSHQDSSK